jgi:hypothetical protein
VRWRARGRSASLLLHGDELDAAKAWAANLFCAGAEWQEPLPLPTHQNGWATPNRFGPLLDGRDGRPSIRPERLLRGCCCRRSTRCQNNTNSRWAIEARTVADVAGFWTVDRTTITGRSAVILRQHTTLFRPMIVPLMIWSLSSKLEKLEPSHTRKFPRVNAQNSKFGPHSTLGRERFFKAGPRR